MTPKNKNNQKKVPLIVTSCKYNGDDLIVCIRIKGKMIGNFLNLLMETPSNIHLFLSENGNICTYKSTGGKSRSGKDICTFDIKDLSTVEYNVLLGVSNNLRNKEIAARCNLNINTLKSILGRLYIKLGVKGKKEAAAIFRQLVPQNSISA